MSTKQIVQDLLEKLPEDVSLHDVAREIEFIAAVREGFAELEDRITDLRYGSSDGAGFSSS